MSKYARYHANRRARLLARLGNGCSAPGCFREEPVHTLQVAHLHGNGGEMRAQRGSAGEITRLLSLSDEDLLAEVTLMCPPCHRAHDLAAGHLAWKGELQNA